MIMNKEINETFHISDPENVDKLVDLIYQIFLDNGLMSIFKTKNKTSFGFDLGEIDRGGLCGWLGDDNTFGFRTEFGDHQSVNSSFDNYNGDGYIEKISIDDSINILHGAVFFFDIKISKLNFYYDFSEIAAKDLEFTIKSRIRHELCHAYKELYIKMLFKEKGSTEINTDSDLFFKEYKEITDIIKSRPNMSDDERLFLTFLYYSCYIEVDANVHGFYEKIRRDKKNNELKSIESYTEYTTYKMFLDNIDKISNKNFISKYKEHVDNIFNKRFLDVSYFKNKSIGILSNTIKKLKSIYDRVSVYGNIIQKDDDISKLKSEFNEHLRFISGYENIDDSEKTVVDTMIYETSYNPIIKTIKLFEYLRKHINDGN